MLDPRRSPYCCLIVCLSILAGTPIALADAEDDARAITIQGKSLGHWIDQANNDATNVDQTVAALAEAVCLEDPTVKVLAADALALLGPKSKAAVPDLLEQFGHKFPWVRVSCQAAVGAVGKDAVPALVDTLVNNTGGPRIRAAFVLGGIGPDAQDAVPAIVKVMEEESPVMQARILGVLGQIDPERFAPKSTAGEVTYEGAHVDPIAVETADWPQFHGPARDNLCRETGLLTTWPEDGPKLLWQLDGLGRGYSSVSLVDGKIITMGDRPVDDDEEAQFVIAFDMQSRQELWATKVGPAHEDGGPRGTPTVDGELLYAVGTEGDLVCLETETGALRWRKNFVDDFQGKFMAVWKFSESPLVDGDRLICTPGGDDALIVALDKQTGELLWKCAQPDLGEKGADGAGYSSAVVAEIGGVRQIVQMLGRGVIGVEADTGRFLWGYNQVANNVANITSPIVRGDYVFATTAYNTGSALLKISRQGDGFQADEVYFLSSRDFQNHHGGVVLVGDHIYGGHGPNRGDPACIDFGTGEVVWKERSPSRGSAAVLYADGHVIFRYDRGEVVLIEATPEAMKIKARFKAIEDEGPAWAHPVIHQGKLYLRHANALLCYDLRALN